MKTLPEPIAFLWDRGNSKKNEQKHGVSDQEAEEPFFDKKRKIFTDRLHSGKEERFRIVGKTKNHRLLFVAFTIRKGCVRIISARDINKKEVCLYEKTA
ncbi:MAG: BrnT family toxin [Candidatus Gottesmanbacteria bacterium]|nr:BrnT family toxin [Candidatus Gottesmanbacteria bacterium]